MRRTIGIALVVALLCVAVAARETNVVQLDGTNFDNVVNQNVLVITTFGAYWCRFSQMLGPVWDQLAQALAGDEYKGVVVASVECETHKDLQQRWGITKYPTIKTWRNGQLQPKEYRGARTVQHFKEYIDGLLSPAMVTVSSREDLEMARTKRMVVGLFPNSDVPEYAIFSSVAEALREYCSFAVSHSADLLGRMEAMPHVVFKYQKIEMPFKHDEPGSFTRQNLLAWATDQCKPLVEEITFENGEELTEEGLPFFIMFTHPDDTYSRHRFSEAVKANVAHERYRIKFLVADGHKFEHPLLHMGKTKQDLPVLAIDSFKHMYDFGKIENLYKPGYMQEFINDLFSGKLHMDFHNQNKQLPPPSDMQKLGPSKKRYSFQRDEL